MKKNDKEKMEIEEICLSKPLNGIKQNISTYGTGSDNQSTFVPQMDKFLLFNSYGI